MDLHCEHDLERINVLHSLYAVAMPPNFGGGFFGKRLCPRTNL